MYKIIALSLLIACALPFAAEARPLSYPGGTMVMLENDFEENTLDLSYTVTPRAGFSYRHTYWREPNAHMDSLQLNLLAKRWNNPGSQANIYLKAGLGITYDSDESAPTALAGFSADWENRRHFVMYGNEAVYGGDIYKSFSHMARIGIAPYIADYGSVHTWLMLQADYDPGDDKKFSVTPLVRLFKGPTLIEAGYNIDRETALFNLMYQF